MSNTRKPSNPSLGSPLTPGAPSLVLLSNLERAGWGDLAGADLRGLRVVLGAIVRLLPSGSAEGNLTVEQIAAAASYSTRWTRECMYRLEELGVIGWRRGGIREGRPTPSRLRVDKARLLALLHIARDLRDAALAELRAETRARIAALRRWVVYRRHKRRSPHVVAGSYLPPFGGGAGPVPALAGALAAPPGGLETVQRGVAAARAQLAAARRGGTPPG